MSHAARAIRIYTYTLIKNKILIYNYNSALCILTIIILYNK